MEPHLSLQQMIQRKGRFKGKGGAGSGSLRERFRIRGRLKIAGHIF